MSVTKGWKVFLNKYMRSGAEHIDSSQFEQDEIRRYRIVFSGLVQGVGFRYETYTIAQKLQLTGFVKNLANDDVYAEIQGPKNKIMYLIESLKSIPRIQVDKVEIDEMEIRQESDFEIAN